VGGFKALIGQRDNQTQLDRGEQLQEHVKTRNVTPRVAAITPDITRMRPKVPFTFDQRAYDVVSSGDIVLVPVDSMLGRQGRHAELMSKDTMSKDMIYGEGYLIPFPQIHLNEFFLHFLFF
jgi:hypothetical protein